MRRRRVLLAIGLGLAACGKATPVATASPPPQLTDEELRVMAEEGFPVGDGKGSSGVVTQEQFDAQDEAVHRRAAGRTVPSEVLEAFQVLEAIEVRDGDRLVGYWTAHLVTVEDYPAVRAEAEALVAGFDG